MGYVAAKQFLLKDGQTISIRRAEIEDAPALMACIKTYLADSVFIPKYDYEIVLDLTSTERWIAEFVAHPNSILMIAECDGEMLGNIDFKGHHRAMMAHTGVIGMGMLSAWRNRGVGTALMSALIDWATSHPIIEILWLQVFAENHQGVGLYQKMGFENNGCIPNYFKRYGQYYDVYTMSRRVK